MNMEFIKKLPTPEEIKKEFPTDKSVGETFALRNSALKDILSGKSDKFILIIGPCSADRREPVMEYINRLSDIYSEVKDKLFIVPRVYTTKPRTSGAGYMGMLHQPDISMPEDVAEGIISIRKLLLEIASVFSFSCADEMLYPENYEYFSDLVGYIAVGARSVESHMYRVVASGADVPVGMKNPTNGNLRALFSAVEESRMPHSFVYRTKEAYSRGNMYSHIVLRGYTDMKGNYIPNYGYDTVSRVQEMYEERNLTNPAVIIDVSHANSKKQYLRQIDVASDAMKIKKEHKDISSLIKGLMIESYLEDGYCLPGEYTFGKSVTDGCLGWEKTRELIYEIADKL